MLLGTFTKDPSDTIDYDVKYGGWLSSFSPKDGLLRVEAELEGTGEGDLVILSCTINEEDIKLWVTGGVSGKVYNIKIAITTTYGRFSKHTVKIKVVNK